MLRSAAIEAAAERFVDYWGGPGTWSASSVVRRGTIVRLMAHLPDEWNAVLEGGPGLWQLRTRLPSQTLLMSFADTVRPSREVVEILSDGCPQWQVATIKEGGHMGALTHPHLVNPVIRDFLAGP